MLQRGTDIQNGEILSQESKCMVSNSNHRQIGSFVELRTSEMLGHQRENFKILTEKSHAITDLSSRNHVSKKNS